MSENMVHDGNADRNYPNQHSTSSQVQDENMVQEERLEQLLIDSIATVTRLVAWVTELQVDCIRREDGFARTYNPKLIEEAREVLDSEDPFNELCEISTLDNTG